MSEFPYFDYIEYFNKIGSTNARAVTMVRNHEVQGHFLLVAAEQTNGHGREDKPWFSPVGGLWFSAGFQNLPTNSNLTLFLGICVYRAVSQLIPDNCRLQLKWPNDLMLDGKKLAGILVERPSMSAHHIAGIGINTNLPTFPPEIPAVSLKQVLHRDIDHDALLHGIFDTFFELLPQYVEQGLELVLEEYRALDFLKNREVTLSTEFAEYTGTGMGVNRDGALLLRLPNNAIQPFYGGTVVSFGGKKEID